MRIHARRGRRAAGFTLIELMIGVAIVGILAKLAYPAYTQSVTKSRRADAKTALLDLAQREERYMSTANVYSTDPVALGYGTGTTFPLAVQSGNKSWYTLTVAAPAGKTISTDFLATATATSSQTADACRDYKLDSAGVQSVANGTLTAPDCW